MFGTDKNQLISTEVQFQTLCDIKRVQFNGSFVARFQEKNKLSLRCACTYTLFWTFTRNEGSQRHGTELFLKFMPLLPVTGKSFEFYSARISTYNRLFFSLLILKLDSKIEPPSLRTRVIKEMEVKMLHFIPYHIQKWEKIH